MGINNFKTEKGWLIVKYSNSLLWVGAKAAEPIEMSFGIWTWVSPRKHVLRGGHTSATWQIQSNLVISPHSVRSIFLVRGEVGGITGDHIVGVPVLNTCHVMHTATAHVLKIKLCSKTFAMSCWLLLELFES